MLKACHASLKRAKSLGKNNISTAEAGDFQ
jgi:hypothetical protein